MLYRKSLLLLTLTCCLWPISAFSQGINLQNGRIRVNTDRDRGISVDSGSTYIEVPRNRAPIIETESFRNGRFDLNCTRGRIVSRQEIRQITRSNGSFVQNRIVNHQCR